MSDIYYVLIAVGLLIVVGGFLLVRRGGRGEALDPPANPSSVIGDGRDGAGTALLDKPTDTTAGPTKVPTEPSTSKVSDQFPTDEDTAALAEAEAATLDEELAELLADTKPNFRERLGRARGSFTGYFGSVLSRSEITEESWDELQEALILADVGIGPTTELLDSVRATVKQRGITTPAELLEAVKAEMKTRLAGPVDLNFSDALPTIWLFVGVNGVGKTTSIGKVGKMLADDGKSVVMAAGDTFRAAAAEQLEHWAEKSGADLVRGAEGGDPSSVIFDAIASGTAKGADVVLADTAGRLHTKTNLMEELSKVRRVADKGEGKVTEVLLVLDATTGQNGLTQARKFTEATDVTGVVLTKMDGSAKGGIVFAIRSELDIPVKLMGLGEGVNSLVEFNSDEFVDALFDQD
ncbi:MAG TPA: signal recognition particle-docking protein FtsY [Microthrixaceae bacterium]|nr:signal recognition particle-docking protein FtsY [Microthrixaceae bacterium]